MSSHIGVSCDSCMKSNFSGRRYKCLSCDNYDLCGRCHDANAESHAHLSGHPMQCIVSKTTHELFYAGEAIAQGRTMSLTCPYCGVCGFLLHTLLKHCLEKHSIISGEKNTQQVVMCPICVVNPSHGAQSRFVSLADHLIREHDDANASLFVNERLPGRKDDLDADNDDDDDDDDEDEGLPLYILAERLFNKEENQQRTLAQALVRNNHSSAAHGTTSVLRRPLSRQATSRSSRGGLRGPASNHPYGTVPRTTTGSFSVPFDTPLESSLPSDSYAAILFAQDPLFDFHSPFLNETTNAPFFLASTLPTSTAASDRITLKRSNLSTTKQNRSSHLQQAVLLTEPLSSDYHSWSQIFAPLVNNASSSIDTDISVDQHWKADSLPKSSEHDPRSLLGKILKTDTDTEHTRFHPRDDHASFFQTLLLSSMHLNIDKE